MATIDKSWCLVEIGNIWRKRTVFGLIFLCLTCFDNAGGQSSSKMSASSEVIDLTHTLTADFPYLPIPGITFPFKKTPIASIDKLGVAANRWEIHEHIGTQIDAPSHFFADGLSLEQMPVRNFIAPLVVVDISERARVNSDSAVTIEDILAWEKKYGRLPKGAAVFMYSGWDSKVNDPKAFINMDASNTMHFPGFSPEAISFLVGERDVVGIGVDTLSLDPGRDQEYKTHKAWLKASKWGVECVANLRQVPPAGATVFVGASKVGGATGGPVRLIATLPPRDGVAASYSSLEEQLVGGWKSATAEPVGNLGFRTREFSFTTDRWKIEVVFYENRQLTTPIFSFVGEGPYKLGHSASGIANAVFYFDRKNITLLTDDVTAIRNFGFGDCGLTKGRTKDISATGCANFTSVAACGQEYDLVEIDDDKLQLGTRPSDGNMCSEEKRPRTLGASLIRLKK